MPSSRFVDNRVGAEGCGWDRVIGAKRTFRKATAQEILFERRHVVHACVMICVLCTSNHSRDRNITLGIGTSLSKSAW